MKSTKNNDCGDDFKNRLEQSLKAVDSLPTSHRNVRTVQGYNGKFSKHPDAVAVEVTRILTEICIIYRFGDDIVMDTGDRLKVLVENCRVCSETPSILANYMLVQDSEDTAPQPPTLSLLQNIFNNELVLQKIPMIERYVKHPTYDPEFQLLQPGFHPESGTMVHGDCIEPIVFEPSDGPAKSVPSIIREMLVDFPFASPIDRVNAIGFLLTAILAHLFTSAGRAIGLFDGNQPGVGKTLFAQVLGVILDGSSPAITEFSSSNDELSKRILSTIRSHNQSVILIDNARAGSGVINSTSLESTAASETLSLRILGESQCHNCRNDFIWTLTMNGLRTTPDLAQRGIRIMFAYDGPASLRTYQHNDLIAFVKEHRIEISASLFGMIEHWKECGMPMGKASHRFSYMAQVVSGILDSCGLSGFLSNHQKSILEIDTMQDNLSALFDTVLRSIDIAIRPGDQTIRVPSQPRPSQEWLHDFAQSGIAETEFLSAKTDRAKAIRIGMVFSGLLGRVFDVEVSDRSGKARLVKQELKQKRTTYHFEVTLDSPEPLESHDIGCADNLEIPEDFVPPL